MSIFVALQLAAVCIAVIFSFVILVVIGPANAVSRLLKFSMVVMAIGGGAAINLMWGKI